MSLYVIADTHLSFNCPKPMDIFGDRWKNHADKLSTRWKSLVGDDDTVVIPGDISWAMSLDEARNDLKFIDSLPGKKILLKGNHDYWWSTAAKINAFFSENNIKSIQLLHNSALFADGFRLCGSRGWYSDVANPDGADYRKIVTREAGRIERSILAADLLPEGEKLVFLHFPPVFDKFVCREITDLLEKYNIRRCYMGHIHGLYNIPAQVSFEGIEYRLVSSDFLDFYPYPIR